MLAIIGGPPGYTSPPSRRALPRALDSSGSPRGQLGVHSPGHVASTDEEPRGVLAALARGGSRGSARSAASPPNRGVLRVQHGARRRPLRRRSPRPSPGRSSPTSTTSRPTASTSSSACQGLSPPNSSMTTVKLYGTDCPPQGVRELVAAAPAGDPLGASALKRVDGADQDRKAGHERAGGDSAARRSTFRFGRPPPGEPPAARPPRPEAPAADQTRLGHRA